MKFFSSSLLAAAFSGPFVTISLRRPGERTFFSTSDDYCWSVFESSCSRSDWYFFYLFFLRFLMLVLLSQDWSRSFRGSSDVIRNLRPFRIEIGKALIHSAGENRSLVHSCVLFSSESTFPRAKLNQHCFRPFVSFYDAFLFLLFRCTWYW